jgi:hypothetical protein
MTTSATDLATPAAVAARVDDDALIVELGDGRSISAPLAWYPRLLHASRAERENLRLSGGGRGIHWPDIDEDISIESILAGGPSMECPASLKRWLDARATRK